MIEKYNIVGKIFKNKKSLEFIVINKTHKNAKSVQLYDVRFIKSGFIAHNISSGHIRNGEVKDYFSPSVFNVGCLGYAYGYAKRNESRRIYYTWRNMLRRCYDKKYRAYKWYGAQGIVVCERWKRLDYFIEDIKKIDGFNLEKFENGLIELDKDIKSTDIKYYSLETCTFVDHGTNNREALNRRWNKTKH